MDIRVISKEPVVLVKTKPVINGSDILVTPQGSYGQIYNYTAPYDFYLVIMQIITTQPINWYGWIADTPINTSSSPAVIFTDNDYAFEGPFYPEILKGETIQVYAKALTTSVTETTVNFNGFRIVD